MRLTAVVGTVVLMSVVQADAQIVWELNVGGGYGLTNGAVEKSLGNGANFDAGVALLPNPLVGLHIQYGYTRLFGTDFQVPVSASPGGPTASQGFSAYMIMHGLSFDAMIRPKIPLRPYFVAGPGIYYRSVTLITPSTGFATICDPAWFVCSQTPVAVDEIIGQRGAADIGANFGGGFTFRLGGVKAYTEVRYLRIWGSEVTSPSAPVSARNTNAQMIPVTFGIRF